MFLQILDCRSPFFAVSLLLLLSSNLILICSLLTRGVEASAKQREAYGSNSNTFASTNASWIVKRANEDSKDDATCQKGTPCKTDACCGSFGGTDTGVCGFGPDFCGEDCDSNCNARSECGQYADPANAECPLSVCCSEFGFCGTTDLFCGDGCQSGCVLEPAVPAGKSNVKVLDNKVIGYYEAWSDRRECRPFPPSAIPVEGLTHVNFAFAYIDPESLDITTMDPATPEYLFAQTTDIKNLRSRSSTLEVYVAIGGWTFSDNDTATQPVFPAIAADPKKRQTFADNLVSFMARYGFDGVDLDWEYPGAPDRGGGGKGDKDSYVELLKTIRNTFTASARGGYGLTFTIPSSYWYLKWFDVPALLEYADWTNLMSYDLHGVWDANNPIGSIVQGHSNLTEIKMTADLLWRNEVRPDQVVLGLGFYGRSFRLEDTACSEPGCQFSGPAEKGACTDSAGTLAYFEIMDILQNEDPEVTHDEDAAVKYITFGSEKDQWVSYDDKTTFAAKVRWANEVGLGGVMIWSVDQDDDSFSALSGLIGQSLPSYEQHSKRTQLADTNRWSSVNGQACKVSDCIDEYSNPPGGYSKAPNGQFPDTCSGGKYRFVYCPTTALPSSCQWRGSGSCHGQCHSGEVTLAHSSHGSKSCLAPGKQAFCCESTTWSEYTDKCAWADGCDDCPGDAPYSVSTRDRVHGFFQHCEQKFCCPYDFQGCHWIGKGTCDDNECSSTEVQVARDAKGDTGSLCAAGLNGRQKPLCCRAPNDLNPFLPVPLDHLFPTTPPMTDVPAFDLQPLTFSPGLVSANPSFDAFLFVVIDGPPDKVTTVNKRDGSHLDFLTGGTHHGQEPQVAHFICMDDSADSNCDDMHIKGLEGTILRMPDNMGFAQWAVAHAVSESSYSTAHHVKRRAPAQAKVHKLEYSYNFSRVRRDAEDVYLRVDYSNTRDYYTDIVEAEPRTKRRSLDRRFWSKISSVWKTLLSNIRTNQPVDTSPVMGKDDFDVLIYGDDGNGKGCSNGDGFLRLGLTGSMRNTFRFGYTLIGTIMPFRLEEGYGYFDSDLYMSGQLSFDGRGVLDINGGAGVSRDLFPSPISNFQASHPGIVSFTPELNAEVSMIGSGEIDGKFTVKFEAGSSDIMTTNAPRELGEFGGDVLNNQFDNAVTGHLRVGDQGFETVLAIQFNLESSMRLEVQDYGTSEQIAAASFSARTPHAIRIVGDTGSKRPGRPGILDAPQQGTSDVVQSGNVMDGWDDGTTYTVGSTPPQRVIFTADEGPPDRDPPEINNYAVFGDRDFLSCSRAADSNLTCNYDLIANDPENLAEPNPPYKSRIRRDGPQKLVDEDVIEFLDTIIPRGPSTGGQGRYAVYAQNPAALRGTTGFEYVTPHYPNGEHGDSLDEEQGLTAGNGPRYALARAVPCDDTRVTATGVRGTNWQETQAEHPVDRSIFPNHFLTEFAQTGNLDLSSGMHTTNLPLFTYPRLRNYFATDYGLWTQNVPGIMRETSAMAQVAEAHGATVNPNVMSNLEANLNALKGRIYTTEGGAISDERMRELIQNPTQQNAENVLSAIRGVFAVFNYMNAINSDRQAVFEGVLTALGEFDRLYAEQFPNSNERLRPLYEEFIQQWDRRVVNFVQADVTNRLNQIRDLFSNIGQAGGPQAVLATRVLTSVNNLRGRIQTEIVLP